MGEGLEEVRLQQRTLDRQLGEETGRFSWPAGTGPSRHRAAMSVHSNTPLVRRKSCILVKMAIAVWKTLSACGHECLITQDMRVQK